jgi:hypothetical protein
MSNLNFAELIYAKHQTPLQNIYITAIAGFMELSFCSGFLPSWLTTQMLTG